MLAFLRPTPASPAATSPPAGLLRIDLGYIGTVGAVALKAGRNSSAGPHSVRFYVTRSADESASDSQACNAEARPLEAGEWAVGACNKEGR